MMSPLKYYRNASRVGGPPLSNDDSAKSIVAKVLEQRDSGHHITDDEVLRAHPHLKDQLVFELKLADQIRRAMLSARRISTNPQELASLTDSAVDAVLDGPESKSTEPDSAGMDPIPRIPGYLLSRELDRGGQAVVYLAVQESTKRAVAIKVMPGGPFASSQRRGRFDREISILATLNHPNIVRVLDRGRTLDGSCFFVMEYVEGQCIEQFWKTRFANDSLGLVDLLRVLAKVACAVEDAHNAGIVHRDLKPTNILVDHRGEPHVLDFGLARPAKADIDIAVQTLTEPGQMIGSLPWASPEQAAGGFKDLEATSDVYSLGVILFKALTGELPYSVQGLIDEVILRIRTREIVAPSKHPTVRKGVDRTLDAIVLKSLAKSPRDRYRSAGGLAKDLTAWVEGTGVVAALPAPRRRRRISIATGILIAVFGAAVPIVIGTHRLHEPVVFHLPAIESSVGTKLVRVPAGKFIMGSPLNEDGRNPEEHPRVTSVDHGFYIATTVVTQQQYSLVMHENPSDRRWIGPSMPAQNVTWVQASEYCRRLSEIDHAHYRLPTETEWEYACRAMVSGPFPLSEHPEAFIYFISNSGGQLHNVGQKWPNTWGLYDMQGNVQQWCSDAYSADRNDQHPDPTPTISRVIRGGSALKELQYCRAASRNCATELFHSADLGFRVVRDP